MPPQHHQPDLQLVPVTCSHTSSKERQNDGCTTLRHHWSLGTRQQHSPHTGNMACTPMHHLCTAAQSLHPLTNPFCSGFSFTIIQTVVVERRPVFFLSYSPNDAIDTSPNPVSYIPPQTAHLTPVFNITNPLASQYPSRHYLDHVIVLHCLSRHPILPIFSSQPVYVP